MIIAGVDLGGRKVSASIFVDRELTWVGHLEVPKTCRARELRTLAAWTTDVLKVADFVFVEEPVIGRGTRASLQLAHTAGAVLAGLKDTITADFVEIATWKKQVVGKGNADKEFVRKWLESSHPRYSEQCAGNQDRCDAVCIGLYGVQLCERATHLAELG